MRLWTEALKLDSPFLTSDTPDDDTLFASEATAVWGHFLGAWRAEQENHIEKVVAALESLRAELRKHMPANVEKVAARKELSFHCHMYHCVEMAG